MLKQRKSCLFKIYKRHTSQFELCVLYSGSMPLGMSVTKRFFMAVWQEEVNSRRADLISIVYFALFILEQLQTEADTMMSGGPEQRWVGESLAHTNTLKLRCTYTHSHTSQQLYD